MTIVIERFAFHHLPIWSNFGTSLQELLGSNLTNFRQLLGMTCELPRQETNPMVTTHTPTQVTTSSQLWGTYLQAVFT